MPWFATKAEKLAWIRQTAEGILDGTVDPQRGANGIWSTALPDVDLSPLQPFMNAGDRLDHMQHSDPRRGRLETEIRDASRALLDNDAFWSQPT